MATSNQTRRGQQLLVMEMLLAEELMTCILVSAGVLVEVEVVVVVVVVEVMVERRWMSSHATTVMAVTLAWYSS